MTKAEENDKLAEYLSSPGYKPFKIGKYQDAIDACNSKLSISPDDSMALLIKADSLSRLSKHQEALEVLTIILDSEPKHEGAKNIRNHSLFGLGKMEELSCQKCDAPLFIMDSSFCSECGKDSGFYPMTENEVPSADFQRTMGDAEYADGEYTKAIEFYDRAVKLDPADYLSFYNKGIALSALEKNEEALEMYLKAVHIDPKYIPSYNNIGTIFMNENKPQEAIKVYDLALSIDPTFYEILYNRGHVLQVLGRYEEAVEMYEKVLEINPNDVEARNNRDVALRAINERHNDNKTSKEAPKTYLFFDTETTGLPRNWNAPQEELENWPRLVQIAWVLYRGNTEISTSNFIIKPEDFEIPIESSSIHGITTERALKEGVPIQVVLDEFQALVEKADYLVAHNMSFDEKIVGAEFLRKNMPNSVASKKTICTKETSTSFCAIPSPYGHSNYKWPKLSELYFKLFGEEFEDAHNALADVNATAKCFWEMRRREIL